MWSANISLNHTHGAQANIRNNHDTRHTLLLTSSPSAPICRCVTSTLSSRPPAWSSSPQCSFQIIVKPCTGVT